jgi:hypothetical protein
LALAAVDQEAAVADYNPECTNSPETHSLARFPNPELNKLMG